MGLFTALKEHKETALMMVGTIAEVGAIALAVRNGIKAKKILDEMPEDSTVGEKVWAIGPQIIPVGILAGISIGSYWWARKMSIDKIVTLGSTAMAIQARAKDQDEAIKETMGEDSETYKQTRDISDKKAYDRRKNTDVEIASTGMWPGYIFEECTTGVGIPGTKDWIEARFFEWKLAELEGKANRSKYWNRSDQIPAWTFLGDYLCIDEAEKRTKYLGWTKKEVEKLELRYSPAEVDMDSKYGCPCWTLSFNIEPHMLDEELPF